MPLFVDLMVHHKFGSAKLVASMLEAHTCAVW